MTTVVTLTGSTLFIMWLGEQISSRGLGIGTSLIIYSGIVANLPQALIRTLELGRQDAIPFLVLIGILIMVCGVIAWIVFMEKAQRKILIQYPKRQVAMNRPAVAQTTHLPLKLNSSGVIPPIFASSLLLLPGTVLGFAGSAKSDGIGGMIASMLGHGKPMYMVMYAAMIIFFAFFYTAIVFNPTETAENLRKMGTYIPGIRPGKSTADYLDHVLTRLTAIGSLYLASVCLLPEFILMKVSLPFYFGGTSLLIVVSTTIETFSQLQSHLLAHQYEGLIKKSSLRGNK
jgi:preprotein translocase subunit SecY